MQATRTRSTERMLRKLAYSRELQSALYGCHSTSSSYVWRDTMCHFIYIIYIYYFITDNATLRVNPLIENWTGSRKSTGASMAASKEVSCVALLTRS